MSYFPPTGSVVAFQSDPTKLVGTVSVVGGVNVFGSVASIPSPASISGMGIFNVNHTGNGSIVTVANPSSVSGVGLFNVNHVGNGSIVTVAQPASVSGVGIFNVNHTGSGSVITLWNSPSIVGTYNEDSAHTTTDKGVFVLGVRNDTVASFVSANVDYVPMAHDSAGRVLVKPFAAEEARLDNQTSVVSTSVTALFTSVAGLRNYVTDVFVANTGSVATLITFRDGSTSVLGYTIAPAGGGSNIVGMAMPFRTAPGQDFVFQTGTASSVLYVSAKGYQAP